MWGAVSGLVVLVAFMGVAELVAVATGPASAPTIAIGQNVIAHVPQRLKEFAVEHFGENDKSVLLAGIYSTLAVLAALSGAVAGSSRRAFAYAAAGVLCGVAAVSAATAPTGSLLDTLPSVAGGVAAVVVVGVLVKDTRIGPALATVPRPPTDGVFSRRQLMAGGASLIALGTAAYVLGSDLLGSVYNAAKSRAAVTIPAPTSSVPRARGTGFDVNGLAPYTTANQDFYRVDTALVVPQLATDGYTLNLHGMVDRPAIYTYDELLGMELVERPITMVCVSNPVGGPYIGNARWTGVPLAGLLRQAGVHPDADQLFMTSSDGMTIGADLATLMDGRPAMLALAMNGEPLPFEHGFPVRAVIPGVYGYASACKWVVDLEVTTFAAKKAYWVERGYAEKAPIKLESKIDTPASFAQLGAGRVTVAGSAWRPGVGVRAVQVQVDAGPWHETSLAAVESIDTWRLWRWEWDATPGTHSLGVRAVGTDGQVQTLREASVVPDGASGRQSVVVTVT